ncbi:MAG: ATP-binding cassette domain-containing protein [Alphaproteobacteria bacterium]
MGRYPHRATATAADDRRALGLARGLAGIEDLWEREYLRLSGGERQRVQFARAVAQVAPVDAVPRALLLDEPTSSLDLRYQHEILAAARRLARDHGVAVAAVTHDPNLAVAYADDVLLLRPGEVEYSGRADGLAAGHLSAAYGIAVDGIDRPGGRMFAWRPAA